MTRTFAPAPSRSGLLPLLAVLMMASAGPSGLAQIVGYVGPAPQTASPAPPQPRLIRISGGVMAGLILNKVDPSYPPDAKAAGIQGAVVLVAIIDEDGTVESLTPVSGPAELRDAAMDAVKQWTYKPYLLNGQPQRVQTTVTIQFNLAR